MEQEKIKQLTQSYYARKDISQAMLKFSRGREVIPRYFEGFGKRPDSLQYESDILELVKRGATSFHCSEEIWKDPLQISTELPLDKLHELREGWDLLIDIDSKYLDYSKISAELIVEALKFHGIKNLGVKFSGSKGMHIIVPWQAFPQEINNIETRKMFPEWPRLITQYLKEITKKPLIEKISQTYQTSLGSRKYIKGEEDVGDAIKKVMPDLILVSSRHLFRMPYSLHEKTALASIVIDKDKISEFSPKDAELLKVKIKDFLPEARKNEARELLIQALDWQKSQEAEKKEKRYEEYKGKEFIIKDLTPELYPPCMHKILQGMQDGKKRALFILINFFRSLNIDLEKIKSIVEEWNKKNSPALKQGYINSQFSWIQRQKKILPPNCREFYEGIGVCFPDEICQLIKNPVTYPAKKIRKINREKSENK